MIRQTQAIVLLLCATLGTGCESDRVLGPDASNSEETGFSVRVSPSEAAFFSAWSGNTVRLTVEALDPRGASKPGPYSVAYSSSAPEIASVSEDGVVTGGAPGSASITTKVTIGVDTRVATTAVTVYSRIEGTYEFDVEVAGGDSWFGPLAANLFRHRFIATLQFDGSVSNSRVVGSFSGMQVVTPEGTPLLAQPRAGGIYLDELGEDWISIVLVSSSAPTWRFTLYVTDVGDPHGGDPGSSRFAGLFWIEHYYLFGGFTATRRAD